MIKYIVDDTHFTISKSTINKFPNSLIYMVSLNKETMADTDRVFHVETSEIIYVDTDVDVFRVIASYMRFPDIQVDVAEEYTFKKVKHLATYLGLNKLVIMLNEEHRGKMLLENLFNRQEEQNYESPYTGTFDMNDTVDPVKYEPIVNLDMLNNNDNNDDTSSVDSMSDNLSYSPENEHRKLTTEGPQTPRSCSKELTELPPIVDPPHNNKGKAKIINNYVSI